MKFICLFCWDHYRVQGLLMAGMSVSLKIDTQVYASEDSVVATVYQKAHSTSDLDVKVSSFEVELR